MKGIISMRPAPVCVTEDDVFKFWITNHQGSKYAVTAGTPNVSNKGA
jgi:hypothetical protein